MATATLAPILKPAHGGHKSQKTISFETALVTPVSEKYRNFLNDTRQRDINAYNRLTNPYYMPPSFNKPFLSFDYRTEHFKKTSSNTILVLLKLQNQHRHRSTSLPALDDLSVDMLRYTITKLARPGDEIYVLLVVSKYDIVYRDKAYYVTDEEIRGYKKILEDQIEPVLRDQVIQPAVQEQPDKQFSLDLSIVFDPHVVYAIENSILEYSPSMVVVCHAEDDEDDRKLRFLLLILSSSSITNYCVHKLSNPVVVVTLKTTKVIRGESQSPLDLEKQTADENGLDRFADMLRFTPSPVVDLRSLSKLRSASLLRRSRSPRHAPPSPSILPMRSQDGRLKPVGSTDSSNGLAPYLSADAALLGRKVGVIHEEAEVVKHKLKKGFGFSRLRDRIAR